MDYLRCWAERAVLSLDDLALDLPSLPRNLGIGRYGTTTWDGRHITSQRSSEAVFFIDKVSGTAVDYVVKIVAAVVRIRKTQRKKRVPAYLVLESQHSDSLSADNTSSCTSN